MKEIDFLPEWYTEGKRRRAHVRRQCAALAIVFLGMMTYNLTVAHRIGRATAELAQFEERRIQAENVTRRFSTISAELGKYRAEADLLKQMDSRIDPAAVAAEISHLMGIHVVLSRVAFISEPVHQEHAKSKRSSSAIRSAIGSGNSTESAPLGDVKFRIVLAGVAASPDAVGALVCRLDESSYFQEVHPSFSRNSSIQVPRSPSPVEGQGTTKASSGQQMRTLQVSEFEITCYLANYEEVENG